MINLTKASPAGCSIALIGLILIAVAGICIWGLIAILRLPEATRDAGLILKLAMGATASLAVAALLIRMGWKMAIVADMSDPCATEKPKVRF